MVKNIVWRCFLIIHFHVMATLDLIGRMRVKWEKCITGIIIIRCVAICKHVCEHWWIYLHTHTHTHTHTNIYKDILIFYLSMLFLGLWYSNMCLLTFWQLISQLSCLEKKLFLKQFTSLNLNSICNYLHSFINISIRICLEIYYINSIPTAFFLKLQL